MSGEIVSSKFQSSVCKEKYNGCQCPWFEWWCWSVSSRKTFSLVAHCITKCATMTIWFPQKNMTLDWLQILNEHHTTSLAKLASSLLTTETSFSKIHPTGSYLKRSSAGHKNTFLLKKEPLTRDSSFFNIKSRLKKLGGF